MSNGRKRDHQTNMTVLQKYREATAKSGSSSNTNKSAVNNVANTVKKIATTKVGNNVVAIKENQNTGNKWYNDLFEQKRSQRETITKNSNVVKPKMPLSNNGFKPLKIETVRENTKKQAIKKATEIGLKSKENPEGSSRYASLLIEANTNPEKFLYDNDKEYALKVDKNRRIAALVNDKKVPTYDYQGKLAELKKKADNIKDSGDTEQIKALSDEIDIYTQVINRRIGDTSNHKISVAPELSTPQKIKKWTKYDLPVQVKALGEGTAKAFSDPMQRAAYEVNQLLGITNRSVYDNGSRGEYLSLLAKYNKSKEGNGDITNEEVERLIYLQDRQDKISRQYVGLRINGLEEDWAKVQTSQDLGAFTGEMFKLWIGGEILSGLAAGSKLASSGKIGKTITNLLASTTNFATSGAVSAYGQGASGEQIAKETIKSSIFGAVSGIVGNVIRAGGTKLLARNGISTDLFFGNRAARIGLNLTSNIAGMEAGLLTSSKIVGDEITLTDFISTAVMAVAFGAYSEGKTLLSKNPETGKRMFSTIKEVRNLSNTRVNEMTTSSTTRAKMLFEEYLKNPDAKNYKALIEYINGEINGLNKILGNNVFGENEYLTSKGGKQLKDTLTGYLQMKNMVKSPYLNGKETVLQANAEYSYVKPESVRTGLKLPQVSSISFGEKSESGVFVDKLIENQGKIKSKNIFNVDKMYLLDTGKTSESIYNYFQKIGGVAVNPTLGEVELTRRGAKDTVHHGIGDDKFIATAAVKDVIEKGDIIDHAQNWKGRGYDTYVIAGRGKINDTNSIVGVIVKSYPNDNHKNKFYLHEVIKIGDDSVLFPENPQHHVTDMAENISEVKNELPPTDNISQPENIVNSNDMQSDENNTTILFSEGLNVVDESGIINQNTDPVFEVYQENKPISNTDPIEYQQKIDNAKMTYNLTVEESSGIEQYVGGMVFDLNGVLLGNPNYESTPFTDYWIENITNGLNKMPSYEGRTYRNLTFESQEEFQAFLNSYQPGAKIVLKNFSSTSKDPNGYVVPGEYIVHMVFDGVNGKDISDSFSIPEQQEVIYLPNTEIEVTSVKTANDGYPLIYVREAGTNGKNLETDNSGNGKSTTGTDNEGQRGNAQGEGNDLRGVQEHGGIQGDGREVGKSEIFKSTEVGTDNTESLNRIKDLNSRRARTPDESRELVDLLYNQFGKDTPEFADVRNDIASPIYSTRSDENISHIVNNLIANENYLYELKKEAGKIKRALEPNEKIMGYIDKIAKGEASIEDFSPLLGLDKYQALIDAQTKVYEVENNGIKSFKERTRLDFKDTVEDFIKNSGEWKVKDYKFFERHNAATVAREIMGEDGERFVKLFYAPMIMNDANKIRYVNEHKQTIKDLKLTPEEFETTMKYGEGIIRNASPKIQNAAKVFNDIAEQIKNDVNATLVLNGYKPIDNPKINLNANEFRDALSVLTGEKQYEQMLSDKIRQFINIAERYGIDSIQYDSKGKVTASVNIPYFPHGEVLNNLQQVKKAMGFSLEVTELPGEITGRTEEFKPNKKWVGNLEKRKGKKTDYDIRNWDNYINNISEVIYHTSDITKLRLLENGLRSKYSQSQIDEEVKIARNLMTNEELADFFATLDQKRDELTEHNNMINWLNEYTNIIAGKKHSADRSFEKEHGRVYYNLMNFLQNNWTLNAVAGNASSVLNQFAQWAHLFEENPIDIATAFVDCVLGKNENLLNDSDFFTTKEGVIKLTESGVKKVVNAFCTPMVGAENITSRYLYQVAYNKAKRKGKTDAEARAFAEDYISSVMAVRSKVGLPTIFASKSIFKSLISKFQIEPNQTMSYLMYDVPRLAKNETGGKWTGKSVFNAIRTLLAYAVGCRVINLIKEKITGNENNILTDPIEFVYNIYKWIIGENTSKDVLDNALENIATLPFMQFYLALLGFDDVGQIPMSNSVPNLKEMAENMIDGNYKKVGGEIVDSAVSLLNPIGGYSQAKKTIKGIGAVMKGAEYTPSGNLRYPIEQSAGNYVRGAFFGKYSLPENKEFWNNNKETFGEEETKEYEYRVQQGENPQDVYNDIYQRKMDNAAESDVNKAYREKANGMINEFDYGTSLKLDNVVREYQKTNPDASTLDVPKASREFSYNGKKYNLTEEQYADLQNRYNKAYYEGVKDIVNDSSLNNAEKYKQISKVRQNVQERIKKQFAREELIGTKKKATLQEMLNSRQNSNGISGNSNSNTNNGNKPTLKEMLESKQKNSSPSTKKPTLKEMLDSKNKISFKNYKVTNYNGGKHKGMDFAVPEGTAVQSTTAGRVVEVLSLKDSYGKFIVIKDNNGNNHYYAHLSGFNCEMGDTVSRGQVIGYSGNTGNSSGPHLHYEVRVGDDYGKQIDPRSYL